MATLNLIRVRDPFSVLFLANASFVDLKAWRNRDTISSYVAIPKYLRKNRKDLEFAQESLRYS